MRSSLLLGVGSGLDSPGAWYSWRVPLLPRVFEELILLIYLCVVPRRCEIGEGMELGYGGITGVPVIDDDVFIGAGGEDFGGYPDRPTSNHWGQCGRPAIRA